MCDVILKTELTRNALHEKRAVTDVGQLRAHHADAEYITLSELRNKLGCLIFATTAAKASSVDVRLCEVNGGRLTARSGYNTILFN
jgi:hypothetical protein